MTSVQCSPSLAKSSPLQPYRHAKAEMPPPSLAIKGIIAQRRQPNIPTAIQAGNMAAAPRSEVSQPGRRPLKPLRPANRAPPKNCAHNEAAFSLPATHPKLYAKPRLIAPSKSSKTVDVHMGLLTPPRDLKPLPSAPLFGPISVYLDASQPEQQSSMTNSGVKQEPTDGQRLTCYEPLDPMHQTSITPPDWQGRIGVLRADTDLTFGHVTSIGRMTGLPLGGMVEIAEYYGPQA